MLDKAIERRNKDGVMGLGEHLEDLRRRVLLSVIGLAPIFIVCLIFGKKLVEFALVPASEALLSAGEAANYQLNSPLEAFGAYFKIAAIITLSIAGPWIIYQLWKFIAPGLYSNERRFVYILAPFSGFMALTGLAFAYFVVLPIMLQFLVKFNATMIDPPIAMAALPEGVVMTPTVTVLAADPPSPQPGMEWINTKMMQRRVCIGMIDGVPDIVGQSLSHSGSIAQQYRLKETLDLIVLTCLSTIVGFQTPVVVLLLGWAGVVSPKVLSKYRRHAIAACAVLGAVLTPSPDPIAMMLIAVPMYLLYELGLLLVVLFPASRIAGKMKVAPLMPKYTDKQPGGPAEGP